MICFCLPVLPLGAVICDALNAARLQQKDAYLSMGIDAPRFSRALQHEKGYSLDLWRMLDLPQVFWCAFLPGFMKALTAHWLAIEQEEARARARLAAVDADRVARLAAVGHPVPARMEARERAEKAG